MRQAAALVLCAIGCGGTSSPSDAPADGDPSPGYAAFGMPGAQNHLRITRAVDTTCFSIQLVSPGTGNGGLTLPSGWAFESAQAMQPAPACDPRYLGPISHLFEASSQTGAIAWQGSGVPQAVQSVQVTLTFANNPAWCPPSEVATASNVPVQ